MMKTVLFPDRRDWAELTKRPIEDQAILRERVRKIVDEVKSHGDEALKKYSSEFDGLTLDQIEVNASEIDRAAKSVPIELRDAIETAASNIRRFHEAQVGK